MLALNFLLSEVLVFQSFNPKMLLIAAWLKAHKMQKIHLINLEVQKSLSSENDWHWLSFFLFKKLMSVLDHYLSYLHVKNIKVQCVNVAIDVKPIIF